MWDIQAKKAEESSFENNAAILFIPNFDDSAREIENSTQ